MMREKSSILEAELPISSGLAVPVRHGLHDPIEPWPFQDEVGEAGLRHCWHDLTT